MSKHASDDLPDELVLLTCPEVAGILRVSRSTVYALHAAGRLPSISASTGMSRACRRWRLLDVKAYVAGTASIAPHVEGKAIDGGK